MIGPRVLCVLLAPLILLLVQATSRAELIAYESFNYAPAGADVLGGNGGLGWSGPWAAGGFNASISTNFDRAAGSLTSGALPVDGNRATSLPQNAISGLVRNFAQPISANETVTRYLSVLLRPEGTLGGTFNGFFGVYLDGNGTSGDDAYIGRPGGGDFNHWVLETRGGSGQFPSTVSQVLNQTTLLVLKAQLQPGADLFTLYVDPVPGAAEPTSGIVKSGLDLGPLSGIALYSTGGFSADEIRWGQTFADVLPVPEPSTLALAVLGVLGLLVAVRRRR